MEFRDNLYLFPMGLANPKWKTYYISASGDVYSIKGKAPPRLLKGYAAKPQYSPRYVLNGMSWAKDELYETCHRHRQWALETKPPAPVVPDVETPMTFPEVKRLVALLLGVKAENVTITIAT